MTFFSDFFPQVSGSPLRFSSIVRFFPDFLAYTVQCTCIQYMFLVQYKKKYISVLGCNAVMKKRGREEMEVEGRVRKSIMIQVRFQNCFIFFIG